MKYISLILISTLIISACDEDRIISSKNDDFITVFKTTDTTGRQKQHFILVRSLLFPFL